MGTWPTRQLQDLLKIEFPLIQAPMAGSDSIELAAAVSNTGGLGSLACALLSLDEIRFRVEDLRKLTTGPFNLNFFCHVLPAVDADKERGWRKNLSSFYDELGLSLSDKTEAPLRLPFDEEFCSLMEELVPPIVSFHFGLPSEDLVRRLKAAGIVVLSSATSVGEAVWLEARGVDAIIAQGSEAGGHRGHFLSDDLATQTGTLSLVPQIVDAVAVPVIAAGGIGDARGIVASLALGASGVQLGTAFLFCPEAAVSPLYRQALTQVKDNGTVLTNLFSGRPARGIVNRFVQELGPLSKWAPPFPLASSAVLPLRRKSEALGSKDFMQMWSGQSASLCREMTARDLVLKLVTETLQHLEKLGRRS